MKTKNIFISALIFAMAVLMVEFVPMSSANNDRKQGFYSPKTTVTRSSNFRFEFAPVQWHTMVNNSFFVPDKKVTFSSYGQPSINSKGLVVFRGRTTGSSDRESGIYMRQFPNGNVQAVADLNFLVPFPNNLNTYFTEFPSIPRISMNEENVATRGNHKPVYKYLLPDQTETRVGTTGIYARLNSNLLLTGASKLGAAPGFDYFAVPNVNPAIPFDVFPGSPAITDDGTIVFKGNYTQDRIGKTGIFYRKLLNTPGGGNFKTEVIANSDTEIPNTPPSAGFKALTFDSTAPPSVAGDEVVFVGLDNEDNPSYGGIYQAFIEPKPELKPLIEIGQTFPGIKMTELTRIGEGLSFDGHYLGFWGAWGNETKTVRLYCPEDGNRELLLYCNGVDPKSIFDIETGRWFQEKEVPLNQGIFIYDVKARTTYLMSNTNSDFNDFVFWGYSGKAPGTGSDEDAEPPRWRSAAFLSVSDGMVAFKARTGRLDDRHVYVDPVDGIYLAGINTGTAIQVLAETGMDGVLFDPSLQGANMPITGLGIEREGFRGQKLALTATMANEEAGWGGIYLANVQPDQLNIITAPKNTKRKPFGK
jgi:hypothetical protein